MHLSASKRPPMRSLQVRRLDFEAGKGAFPATHCKEPDCRKYVSPDADLQGLRFESADIVPMIMAACLQNQG